MVSQTVDPVTTEIVRNALISAAKEMNASLFRSAYTPIIYEMKDCSVGIFDRDLRLMGQSAGLPIFLGNLEAGIQVTIDRYRVEQFHEGDVYILNDAYLVGTHLNDITVFSPIFYMGQLVGFTANRAHWLDIGSKDPGYPNDSVEIYQEGIRIPPLKVIDRGETRDDVVELLSLNSRFHRSAFGDLHAQIAACRTGEERFSQIIERFGLETVQACLEEIFRQTEAIDREGVREIPDGVYRAEGSLDNDGHGADAIHVQVAVEVHGDEMTIDLTGSSPQVQGSVNCGIAQTLSACRVAFKQLVNPGTPVNGGNFRNLRVLAPDGSIFAASEPAACAWYFTPLGLLIDLVARALAEVMPRSVAAAHYGDSMVTTFAGQDDGLPFLDVEATVGGWGGYADGDGESALINAVNGDFKNLPIEVLESKYPLRVREYGFRTGSCGHGKCRGGCGGVREYELLSDDVGISLWFERAKTPAWGILGGRAGAPPDVVINPGTLGERHVLKCNSLRLERGTVVRALTGGGGGYMWPMERPPEEVREDVLDEIIDLETAATVYGVVFDRRTLSVDGDATAALRSGSGSTA